MYFKKLLLQMPFFILSACLMLGCASQTASLHPPESPTIDNQLSSENSMLVRGKILGFSKKATSISIKVGQDTQLIRFTAQTKGIEHIKKGHAVIITYKTVGKSKIATLIKAKIAKLPPGTSEIQPDELFTLLSMPAELGNYILIDARPANKFAAGHIASAISIPAAKLKNQVQNPLPDNKEKILIFYCGGTT